MVKKMSEKILLRIAVDENGFCTVGMGRLERDDAFELLVRLELVKKEVLSHIADMEASEGVMKIGGV